MAAAAKSEYVSPIWIVANTDGKFVPKGIAIVTTKQLSASVGGTKV